MDANQIRKLLTAMATEGDTAPAKPALMDVALRDEAAFYTRENPFAVGDLVTPRKASTTGGAGDAHIVIAVIEDADFHFQGKPGCNTYGQRLDLRVLKWVSGRYAAFWCESAEFEPWVDPQAQVTIALGEVAA
ncbi:hypothetical protein ACLBXO_16330 [Methylobacterium sp. C33D]